MKWLTLVLLFHLLLICGKCNKVINIASQDHLLQSYLCHHYNYTGDTTLLLLDTVYNISGNGSLCTINTKYTLTIQGNYHSMATIQCISSTHDHLTIGFAFTGSSTLTLQRVTFTGCGANLTTLDNKQLNIINSTSSLVYFTQHHAAVLVFTEISHLVMRYVNISQYYGFAIVAVNLPNGTLDSINVVESESSQVESQNNNSIGCGVLLLYRNSLNRDFNIRQYQVMISSSNFIHNYELRFYTRFTCITDYYNCYIPIPSRIPVVNAAGLTILYTQNDTSARVNIFQCTFRGNMGSISGAILVLHLNSITHSQTIIDNHSVFDTNGNYRESEGHGSAIVFFFIIDSRSRYLLTNEKYQPLQLSDVTFEFTDYMYNYDNQLGVVHISMINVEDLSILIKFSNVTFIKNQASNYATCIFASTWTSKKNNVQFLLDSIKAINNNIFLSPVISSPVSIFQFIDINNITIRGSEIGPSNFSFNYGTVIHAIRSNIILKGHIVFHNNTSINGAAILLIGDSHICLTEGLRANFTNNRALSSGGAIYANGYDESLCTFQGIFNSRNTAAVLSFVDNTATVAGNSIYSAKLYNCYMDNNFVNSKMATDIYNTTFTIIPNNIYEVSTTPIKLSLCGQDSQNTFHYKSRDAYPGQTLNFSMAAKDPVNHHSYSIVTITTVRNKNVLSPHINLWFSEGESIQVVRETDECTLINVTIHTNTLDVTHYGSLLFTIPSTASTMSVAINLKHCPPGFEFNNVTGSCICSSILLTIPRYTPNCSINTRTFKRPTSTSWVGCNEISSIFQIALHCHHSYCNIGPSLVFFHINDEDKFVLTTSKMSMIFPICRSNRKGTLCGKCLDSYSVVFGSKECRLCSNWWLWTLVLYAVAGPLLIYLLYALRLTLTTGTFNGIIFYAQAANVGILGMLSIYNGKMGVVRNISIILLSALNLGLGFPLCFYNGMTELWKAGLSLLFPLYLLTIVVVLIILSRFSLRLSNRIADFSVQVLVTVVHLSYGRLLGAIINAFTFAKVFTSEQTYHVWYWDGSVKYGSKGHITLIAITSLVVFPLLLTYILLLLFAKSLRHWTRANEYTRPIIEAIHAPYKNGKQYWFVTRLLLLIIMYIWYSIEPYSHTIYIAIASILLLFIIGQAMFRPYKSNFVNLLDCWFLFNLAFIYFTTWYLGHMEVIIYNIVAIFLFFVTFFMVLVYHILFITGQVKNGERKVNDICKRIRQYMSHFSHKRNYGNRRQHFLPLQDSNDSFYLSCDNFREPMLNSK